jgi:ectoine hydroxylase-related dioxygenase (phytanoyl-CoA dioxygenase family)
LKHALVNELKMATPPVATFYFRGHCALGGRTSNQKTDMTKYDKLAKEFHQRGYLIIDELFPQEKIAEIERELGRYINQLDPAQSAGIVVYEPNTDGKIRNLFAMEKHDDYFAELTESPELLELTATIFDDCPVSMAVELFGKPALVGTEVPYHQDNAYFNLIPDQALTIWIALADATLENGCVRYIEGSHKFGNLPHRASGVKGNSMRLTEVPPDAGPEVCGIVRRGGALIHHCNTIHRSEPNRSNHDRPGLLFVFKAARCKIDAVRTARYNSVVEATK